MGATNMSLEDGRAREKGKGLTLWKQTLWLRWRKVNSLQRAALSPSAGTARSSAWSHRRPASHFRGNKQQTTNHRYACLCMFGNNNKDWRLFLQIGCYFWRFGRIAVRHNHEAKKRSIVEVNHNLMSIQPNYLYLCLDTKWACLKPYVGGA